MNDVSAAPDDTHSPRWRFWGTLIWGVVVAVVFFIVQVFLVSYMAARRLGPDVNAEQIVAEASNGSTIASSTSLTAIIGVPLRQRFRSGRSGSR